MTSSIIEDPLARLTPDRNRIKIMMVQIIAVDYTQGQCTVSANDGGPAVAGIPFYGSDPVVGDICLAFNFDGILAVIGNQDYDVGNKSRTIRTEADPCVAASGWSVTNSYMDYSPYSASLYLNVTRTGATIAGSSGGNITNTTVASIKAGLPLPATSVGVVSMGGDRQIGGQLTSAGVISMAFLGPNLTFNTGFTFNASASYIRGS